MRDTKQEILKLHRDGYKNIEVSRKLEISKSTVSRTLVKNGIRKQYNYVHIIDCKRYPCASCAIKDVCSSFCPAYKKWFSMAWKNVSKKAKELENV